MRAGRPSPSRRLSAWVVTGPLGHLYGGLLDWAEIAAKLALARARGKRLGEP
jgi:hypothetical protein